MESGVIYERKIRRVVTGHDANGKAVCSKIGLAPRAHQPARPGHISVELWKTNVVAGADRGAKKPIRPKGRKSDPSAPNGTVFRISEIAPGDRSDPQHRCRAGEGSVQVNG